MTVNPSGFVEAMTNRWQTEYNNTANPALQKSWEQLAVTLNTHITGIKARRWSVLSPPTGTGKSKGLALYCAMLPQKKHPGVLIVVRMKAEADALAAEINCIAGSDVAISTHGDNERTQAEHISAPILIATHSAYENALLTKNKWESLMQWHCGERKLTVIDEALNIVRYEQVDLDELQRLRGHIPYYVAVRNSTEIAALDAVIDTLKSIADSGVSRRTLSNDVWDKHAKATFCGLQKQLKKIRLDAAILGRNDIHEHEQLESSHADTLSRLECILEDWSFYARKGKEYSLSTARVIHPKALMSAVVLDATAALNPLYKLLGDKVELIKPPEKIRSYENVTLYYSIGHRVGKGSLSRHASREASTFLTHISQRLNSDDRLLVCTHKATRPHLEGYGERDKLAVAHWGAIDGKNDWEHFNAVAFYGLSYLDKILPELTLIALTKWRGLHLSPENHEKIVELLYWGHIKVALVQAINRVRCRRPSDNLGNCLPTNVFLLLPSLQKAEPVKAAISKAMPGMKVQRWLSPVAKKRLRRSRFEAPLLSYLGNLDRGKHLAKEIREHLKIPKRAFEKLVAKLKDEASLLHHELKQIGFKYESEGVGRGAKSWFVMC